MTTATAEQATTTRTITLAYQQAVDAIAAVIPHTSNDPDSPTLTAIGVFDLDGKAALVATDRYSVGIYTTDEPALEATEPLLITAEVAKAILAIKPANLLLGKQQMHGYHIRIEQLQGSAPSGLDGQVRLSLLFWPERDGDPVVESTSLHFPVGGNFPPLLRLLKDFEPASGEPMIVALTARHLAKFIASAKAVHEAENAIKLELSSTLSAKPGPVRLSIGSRFVGLLQPNLLKD